MELKDSDGRPDGEVAHEVYIVDIVALPHSLWGYFVGFLRAVISI